MTLYRNNRPQVVSSSSSAGIGFPGLLTIVFVTLKLLGHITWSWWWVLSPLWIMLLLVIVFFSITLLIVMKYK